MPFDEALARRHARAAIEVDGRGVEIGVLHDLAHKVAKFCRIAHPIGKEDRVLHERVDDLFWKFQQHGGCKYPG